MNAKTLAKFEARRASRRRELDAATARWNKANPNALRNARQIAAALAR